MLNFYFVLLLSVLISQPFASLLKFGRLHEDQSVKLVLMETLRSGRAQKGQRVLFEVSDSVEDQAGNIVIRKGTKAYGEVENSRSAGMMGRRGVLNIRIQHTTSVDGRKVTLRATQSREGSGNKGLITAGFWLVAWPMMFIRGNNVTLEAGSPVIAWVDESRRVALSGNPAEEVETELGSAPEHQSAVTDSAGRIAILNPQGDVVGYKEWNEQTDKFRFYDANHRRTTERMIQKILDVQN